MQDETGYVAVAMIEAQSEYRLPLSEYDRVLAEWKAGAAFITTTLYHGSTVTIKGSRIESVARWMPDQLAAYSAEVAARRAADILRGDG